MPLEELTADPKTSIRFRYKFRDKIKEFLKKTHFTEDELDAIVMIYFNLKNQFNNKSQTISCKQFKSIIYTCYDMPESDLTDRILYALDRNMKKIVTLDVWIKTFSLFLRGTLEEKITYCFTAYDAQGDGILEREQMLYLARNFLANVGDEDDEGVKDYVNIIIRKMDLTGDGKISFKNYSKAVRKNPELLECFGQVLPDRIAVYTVLMTFTSNMGKF